MAGVNSSDLTTSLEELSKTDRNAVTVKKTE